MPIAPLWQYIFFDGILVFKYTIVFTVSLDMGTSSVNKIFIEIRAGTGGDEAAVFAGDLARMYQKYAQQKGWGFGVVDDSPTSLRGYKFFVARITGEGVYDSLKQESGVHRVQRIPETERSGRVHTSTATVAILDR